MPPRFGCAAGEKTLGVDFDEDDVGVADVCRDVIALYKIDRNSTAMTQILSMKKEAKGQQGQRVSFLELVTSYKAQIISDVGIKCTK